MFPITDNPTITRLLWKWKLCQWQRKTALLAASTKVDVLWKYPACP